jgi:hypothetical protein
MMARASATVLLVILLTATGLTAGESIYGLITRGEIERAEDSLASLPSSELRDGNMLFYASLIETDAEKSVDLMRAALRSSVSPIHREEIYNLLAEYYYLKGDYTELRQVLLDYLTLWESGRHRGHMMRLAALVDEQAGALDAARRQADRYLMHYPEGHESQWGLVDKARIMAAEGRSEAAEDVVRELSRSSRGPGVPVALTLLAQQAIAANRSEDAMFYYNLLRDGYPGAVGIDGLTEQLSGMPEQRRAERASEQESESTQSAEEPTQPSSGPVYSVRVGVFSVPDNARRQADRFADYGKSVDIVGRTFGGNSYRVVLVGQFSDESTAAAFKRKLEAEHNEVYLVVTR